MKKLFTLFAMLACVAVASAQHRLVATLSHNDTVSVYYGEWAFANAYDASVDGDVITLSSGVFVATNIHKSITIRGAGMEQDTVNNIAPTIIDGSSYIDNSPTIESVFWKGDLKIEEDSLLVSAKFIKCRLTSLKSGDTYDIKYDIDYGGMYSVEFIQSRVESLTIGGNNITIINSYVGFLINRAISQLSMTNCVVSGDWSNIDNTIFANCVLKESGYGYSQYLPASNMAYNCISIKENVFANLDVNTNNARVGAAFKDTGFYELIDSVKTKYLGTDGTEVGIYGGPAPFNPTKTSYPRIEKFSVSQMNENGEVKVDVKVSTVEE